MKSAGLPIPAEYFYEASDGETEDGEFAAKYFLGLSERPTALVCYNDLIAIGMMKGLQQAGIRIPENVSITGFDNIIFSAYTNPPLTTLDQPKRFIGAEAARLLLELLNMPVSEQSHTHPKVRRLKGKLLIRESTGSPAS
jgi:DNA-binding LacI/PurR family transcriptional regulator